MTMNGSLLSHKETRATKEGIQRSHPLQRTAIHHTSNRREEGAGISLRAGSESSFYQQNFTKLPLYGSWFSGFNPTNDESARTGYRYNIFDRFINAPLMEFPQYVVQRTEKKVRTSTGEMGWQNIRNSGLRPNDMFGDARIARNTVASGIETAASTTIQRSKAKGKTTKAKKANEGGQEKQLYIKDVDGIFAYLAQANDHGQTTMNISGLNAAEKAKTGFWQHLKNCSVQVASSNRSNAFHKNDKGGIPGAPVFKRDGPLLGPNDTTLIEFCVTGQKTKCGIERAVFDRNNGAVYVTKHYDEGKFVQLSDAPDDLSADWSQKADTYASYF